MINFQMTNKIKILHTITGLGFGGAEKVVLDLTTHLNQNGYGCTVATINNEVDRLDQFKANNIALLIGGAEKQASAVLKSFQQIVRFVKKEKIKIIHAHLFHGLMAAYYVKLFYPSIKIVFSPHSVGLGSKLRNRIVQLTKNFRNIDLILHQNNLRNFTKKKYQVIHNGIVIPEVQERSTNFKKFIFLAVGNLRKEKNHLLLVNAAQKLLEANHTNFEIQIAGEGKMRKKIEVKIEKHQLNKHFKLLGNQQNLNSFYKKAHAFVLPSNWEGTPLSALEAASYKLPVIATQVGIMPEIITSGNGWLTTENDFHKAMIEVLQNYPQALKKAEKLHLLVIQNFSQKKLFKQFEKVYEQLV